MCGVSLRLQGVALLPEAPAALPLHWPLQILAGFLDCRLNAGLDAVALLGVSAVGWIAASCRRCCEALAGLVPPTEPELPTAAESKKES